MWRRGFSGRLIRRIAHEQPLPHERFALPQQSLSVLIHLRPQPDLVERTVEAHLMLGPLDEHDIAVTRATDAFVAYGFSRNLQWQSAAKFEGGRVTGTLTLQSMRRAGKTVGHSPGVPAQALSR